MYYTHSYRSEPEKIGMSFDCANHQHQFRIDHDANEALRSAPFAFGMGLAAYLRPYLACPIYMKLFNELMKTVCCANSFCNACLGEWRRQQAGYSGRPVWLGAKCPICRRSVVAALPNGCLKALLEKFVAKPPTIEVNSSGLPCTPRERGGGGNVKHSALKRL